MLVDSPGARRFSPPAGMAGKPCCCAARPSTALCLCSVGPAAWVAKPLGWHGRELTSGAAGPGTVAVAGTVEETHATGGEVSRPPVLALTIPPAVEEEFALTAVGCVSAERVEPGPELSRFVEVDAGIGVEGPTVPVSVKLAVKVDPFEGCSC